MIDWHPDLAGTTADAPSIGAPEAACVEKETVSTTVLVST